jgi:hypothetical protein
MLAGLLAVISVFGATMALASPALAAEAPEWVITSYTSPTNLAPGGTGKVVLAAVNVGGAATDGSAITIEDTLPSGLTATSISGYDTYADGPVLFPTFIKPAAKMTCTSPPELTCTRSVPAPTGDQLIVTINVDVESGAPASVLNKATVSGGGAPQGASASSPITVSSTPAKLGLAPGSAFAAFSSHQAGAHADVTTGFAVNTTAVGVTAGDPKDISFDLPPGAVGNTVGMPRCSVAKVDYGISASDCPADTIVGVATVGFEVALAGAGSVYTFITPIYNIAPSPGEPAAFQFRVTGNPVRLDTTVLSDGNDGVRVTASDLAQTEPAYFSYVTIWGVPADHQGPGAIPVKEDEDAGVTSLGAPGEQASRVPLLSSPTQCATALSGLVRGDFWRAPGVYQSEGLPMGSMTGCLELPFESSFSFLPDTLESGAPAGYDFQLKVHQENSPDSLSTSDVRSVSLKLPEGVVVNPSAAWGLKACSEEAFYGTEHPSQQRAPLAKCPRESQIGVVSVKTPALEEALEGQVYLAEPVCGRPCTSLDAEEGKMVRLFVQMVSEGEGGIVVKLQGRGLINQATGQITTVFEENPQLPFSQFKLTLSGGPRSVLANPRTCGTVEATGELEPWSALEAPGEAQLITASKPYYEFEINQNCHGPEFNPSFKAGMPNIQAGEKGEFTLAFGRPDNSEMLKSIAIHTPEGLMGSLTGIPLCKEAEANAGTCSEASLLGSAEVLTGPGADPFLVQGGKVFLTEGYGGAPFGLSIVVPAKAGPYTLAGTTGQGTVVVRSQIFVDRRTAQLTVVSGEMPHMLDGIPLQLKAVNVRIDRPHFMFNPTSCNKMAITGTLDAVEGMSAQVESPFQVTNCAALPFKPGFTASTKARHSRKGGAQLQVDVTSGEGQADIAKVHVELPKKLPSRLSTLQQACTEEQFAANPAGCPAASVVGEVAVQTPVLPVPLTGPAYFVSHGGAKFPELILVLQGYGVTVELNGETFISKAGITSSTFNAVPDVPFSRFQLTLPEGPHSALAANGSLCDQKLLMPTTITGQNGAVAEQSTKIKVTGCASMRKKKHRAKKHEKARGKHEKHV